LNDSIKDVVEFGSGYGTFTLPAAKIVSGNVYAFEIDALMIKRLTERSKLQNISNIKILNKDFMENGTGLTDNSVDFVMLFNILHTENPLKLLKEAYRILKKEGKLGIIHWIYSEATPRGPSLTIRPKPEQCLQWMESVGFNLVKPVLSFHPYHYGILGQKKQQIINQY
jgi:SAM-dependent methyltransferase